MYQGAQYFIVRAALSKLWRIKLNVLCTVVYCTPSCILRHHPINQINVYRVCTLSTIEYVLGQQDRGSPTEYVSVPCPISCTPYSMYAHIFVIIFVYLLRYPRKQNVIPEMGSLGPRGVRIVVRRNWVLGENQRTPFTANTERQRDCAPVLE